MSLFYYVGGKIKNIVISSKYLHFISKTKLKKAVEVILKKHRIERFYTKERGL